MVSNGHILKRSRTYSPKHSIIQQSLLPEGWWLLLFLFIEKSINKFQNNTKKDKDSLRS
jgi:hypothetical protein